MATKTGRFSRSDRLRKSRDYQRVAARGDRFASREFVVLVAPAGPAPTARLRLGITTSRRVGNAVVRNRIRRSVRDWFRRCRDRIGIDAHGVDVVVIARREAAVLAPLEIGERLCALFERRGRALRAGGPA